MADWDSSGEYKSDKEAFLFSLSNSVKCVVVEP